MGWAADRRLLNLFPRRTVYVAGWALGVPGLCPLVRRTWTPTWTLYNGVRCLLRLETFYGATDLIHRGAQDFRLVVVGMNLIAVYCVAQLCVGFITQAPQCRLGPNTFLAFAPACEPPASGARVLLAEWLILWRMYRRKRSLKIWEPSRRARNWRGA